MSDGKDTTLIQLVKNLVSKVENGSVTFSKQDGEVMRVTAGETHLGFDNFSDYVNTKEEHPRTILPDSDLYALLAYLEGVRYGTVSIRIQDARIVGIEKNETYKVR
ncbi:MAG: YezD family protein [Clostridiales Family XIII bacterium]|jgi:hypothetical protein|nr:YezD family protein [Clostridiales Family XIII bacterium]